MYTNEFNVYIDPISGESACGNNLEDTPEFTLLENLVENSLRYEVDVSELNWKSGVDAAKELLTTTRDVRVAIWLSRSAMAVQGYEGLASGLNLSQQLISKYWEKLHPIKDDGDNYPIARFNAIADLVSHELFLAPIKALAFVELKGVGRYSYRDWTAATERNENDETKTTEASIIAAISNANIEEVSNTHLWIRHSIHSIAEIEATLSECDASEFAPNLSPLSTLLEQVDSLLMAHSDLSNTEEDSEILDNDTTTNPETKVDGVVIKQTNNLLQISSRLDAEKAIDAVSDYFKKAEPSSPIPLLLLRAKTLLHKDFVEILRNFAPSGLSDIESFYSSTEGDDEDD